jgi:hypothetical protein
MGDHMPDFLLRSFARPATVEPDAEPESESESTAD